MFQFVVMIIFRNLILYFTAIVVVDYVYILICT